MMHHNDQYMMHKRAAAAYHQVHHSHDTQPFFYPTTANIHDPTMFSSHPKLVPVHQFNHTVPQQEVLISPSSRNGGVSSTAGSSLPSNKPNSHATPLKGASSSKGMVIDETQTTHVPFEQRFLLSDPHNEYSAGFYDHDKNPHHPNSKSKHNPQQVFADNSSAWYHEPVEFYPVSNPSRITSHSSNKYFPLLRSNNGENFVRRVQSFHHSPQNSQHQLHRRIVQPIYADHTHHHHPHQFGTNYGMHPPYLVQPSQTEFMGEIKLRHPVVRHYSTLGHRKRPVAHQMYPATKTNPIGIMIRGGSQNFIHKSQSLRRNSPYNVRRFPASMAYPVSEILQQNHIVTISKSNANNDTSIQSEGGNMFGQDVDYDEAEEASHSMPCAFAKRFNSSIRGRKKRAGRKIVEKENTFSGFDNVLTMTRLTNHGVEGDHNGEIHTVSLESKQNSLPNPKHRKKLVKSPLKPHPKHLVKVNNYVGSLDRRVRKNELKREQGNQEITDMVSSKMQSLDYKKDQILRNGEDNSISSLGQHPFDILCSTLENIEENPIYSANVKHQRSEKWNDSYKKRPKSFSSANNRTHKLIEKEDDDIDSESYQASKQNGT